MPFFKFFQFFQIFEFFEVFHFSFDFFNFFEFSSYFISIEIENPKILKRLERIKLEKVKELFESTVSEFSPKNSFIFSIIRWEIQFRAFLPHNKRIFQEKTWTTWRKREIRRKLWRKKEQFFYESYFFMEFSDAGTCGHYPDNRLLFYE